MITAQHGANSHQCGDATHTVQQFVDYLNTHRAPSQLIAQVRSLHARHLLNAQTFQDLSNRFGWRPRGASMNDAVNWIRQGINR